MKPLQGIERSYFREKEIQVFCFVYHYRRAFMTEDNEETTREEYHRDAGGEFLIPRDNING